MNPIEFSVLLSVYHKEKPSYLQSSLKSIWDDQLLKPDEIVIVKDGLLTPELDKVIEDFSKIAPVVLVPLEINQGLSAALNCGLNYCSHNIIARMDTDDISLPDRFEKQIRFLGAHPSSDVIGSFALKIDENGQIGGTLKVPESPEQIHELIWTCPMIHPTVCFRKEKIQSIGGYDPTAGPRQDDYDLWFRCAAAGYEFHNLPEPLLLYRFTDENIKKNDVRVGFFRLKTGWKGNRKIGAGIQAYIGIFIPFFRSLFPYPLNIWLYKFLNRFNPRAK
ncbi:MAG TPA: glycosyltransferase [Prolixibacteraceae bacterium]|nr:glycosyltransferase [Prolixibacteraceae bacterium]